MDPHVVAINVRRRLLLDPRIELETDSSFQVFLELLGGPAMPYEQEVQPRPLAMLAQLVRVTEDFGNTFDNWQHLVPAHKNIQASGQMRIGRKSAAHAQRETHLRPAGHSAPDRG